jgi:hypothetical protein
MARLLARVVPPRPDGHLVAGGGMAELALPPRRAAAAVVALRAAPRLGRTPAAAAPTGSGELMVVLTLHAVDGEE